MSVGNCTCRSFCKDENVGGISTGIMPQAASRKCSPTIVGYHVYETLCILLQERFQGLRKVIIYCMKSQQRGPFSAQRLASRLAAADLSKPEVLVMRGGFYGF